MKIKTIYLGQNRALSERLDTSSEHMEVVHYDHLLPALKDMDGADLMILEEQDGPEEGYKLTSLIKEHMDNPSVLLFVISDGSRSSAYLKSGADDVFASGIPVEQMEARAIFLKEHLLKLRRTETSRPASYALPVWKRAFDIVFASISLLFLSPLFAMVALLIRIESKGKVFYAAKRVGTGFRVFDFYKFRSMYTGADKKLAALMTENQYAGKQAEASEHPVRMESSSGDTLLMHEEEMIGEQEYLEQKRVKQDAPFFKVVNDPRITKVGRFIRNTSIDELPQLLNILKGDMSVVGNRPLPLYEAEMLTSDQWAQRFLAPAGLTGLWQISKRAKAGSMSSDERKQLDIDYAAGYSFLGDVSIILKTFPALLQHENV